jgi:hypothetical protein
LWVNRLLDKLAATTYDSGMTKALEDAFREASRLPESEQDALAAAITAELEAEAAWKELLSDSADALGKLADEALTEYQAGRTEPLDPAKQ